MVLNVPLKERNIWKNGIAVEMICILDDAELPSNFITNININN